MRNSRKRYNRILKVVLGAICASMLIGMPVCAMTQDELISIWKLGEQYGEDYAAYEFVKRGLDTQEAFDKAFPNSIFNSHYGENSQPTTPQPTPTPETPKCEHEYTFEVTLEPSCIAEGVKTFTCTLCGDTYDERIDIDTTAHSYECEHTLEANCIEKGEDTYTCTLCGDTYTQPVEMLGHDYVEAVTTEPTCEKAGVKTYTCIRCNDSHTEDIKELGHDDGTWSVTREQGIFTDGSKELICNRCGTILSTEEIPSTYPIWILYSVIGAAVVIIMVVVLLVVKKKKIKL